MSQEAVVTIVSVVCALLGGMFGQKLLDRWFDRARLQTEQAGAQSSRSFADNEQARVWLRTQLDERDDELKLVRDSERKLFTEVSELRAQVARQEERTAAQTSRIDDLAARMATLGADYAEMKSERDAYRSDKHELLNKLTVEHGFRQMAEKDLEIARQEIERLKGEVAALAKREQHP